MYPIGFIKKAHGIKGEIVLVHEEGAPPEMHGLFFFKSSRGDYEPVRIEAIRPNGRPGSGMFFVLFSGITNRSEAETLQGLVLYSSTEPEAIAQPDEEEVYMQELHSCEGYQIEDTANGISGYIIDVMETPAHPVFEIQLPSALLLVPVVDAYISTIDHEEQQVSAQNLDAFFDTEES